MCDSVTTASAYNGLTISDIVGIAGSIVTAITAILTYLMLKETKKSIEISNRVAEENRKRLESEMVFTIYRNFKETYIELLKDPHGMKALAGAVGKDKSQTKIDMFASFLINNTHQMFVMRERGLIDDDTWGNFILDIKEFYSWNFISHRWKTISKFYPNTFKSFVDELRNSDDE